MSETGELGQANPAVLLPEQLLQPGEVIVLALKPSLWFILLGSLRFLAVVIAAAMILAWLRQIEVLAVNRQDLILATGGLIMLRLFWQFLEWLSRVYVLTDRRVVRVKGVIQVDVFEASLKQIQHTQTHFTLLERIFALGTIGFATAGTAVPEAYWLMIARPLEVHQTVVRTLERYR